MRQHISRARAGSRSRRPRAPEPPESAGTPAEADDFEFSYKPREVKDYLDRFVIKQDEAKKVLSVALCDHYHHVRLALEGQGVAELRQTEHHPASARRVWAKPT